MSSSTPRSSPQKLSRHHSHQRSHSSPYMSHTCTQYTPLFSDTASCPFISTSPSPHIDATFTPRFSILDHPLGPTWTPRLNTTPSASSLPSVYIGPALTTDPIYRSHHFQPTRPPPDTLLPSDIVTDPRDLEAAIRTRYSSDPMNDGRRVDQSARTPHAQASSSPEKPHNKKTVSQPLRRGDACLMCRAKKLKCSASKPTCDQCAKRKDRCIYDAVRPASRVERLERKLAEMEEAELRDALAACRHSAQAMLPLPVYPNTLHQLPVPDFSVYPFTNCVTQSLVLPPTQIPSSAAHKTDNSIDGVEGQAAAAPLTTQVSWAWQGATTDFNIPQQPINNVLQAQPDQLWGMPQDMNSWSASTWDNSNPSTTPASIPTPASSAHVNSGQQQIPEPLGQDPLATLGFVNFDPVQTVLPVPPGPVPSLDSVKETFVDPSVNNSEEAKTKAVKLEERDISQPAREYLLELFFCPPRQRYGSEVWSEAQFRAKMALPAGQRPHSCLLFAIYTIAASSSFIPSIRQLAEPLSEIALAKIRESIANEDRLLDAINSTKMIGKWMLSKARALEAWQLTWQSASLVMACQLHKIPSSIYRPEDYESKGGDNPWPLLGPPKDQWELAERIHTFWAIWGHETGSSLIIPWATAFKHETILTPFPRLPDDYLNGTIYKVPDVTIRDLYILPLGPSDKRLDFNFGCILGAAHLLHRTKRIRNEKPETNPTFRQLAQMAAESKTNESKSSSTVARRPPIRKEYPAAYEEIMSTARYMQDNMPEPFRIKPDEERPWVAPDVPLAYECLIATRMLLHDMDGDEYDRIHCLEAAKELIALIRLWVRELALDDEDLAKPLVPGADARRNRHKQGIGGAYALTPWFWAAERMAKAADVFKKMGQEEEARKYAEDANMVIVALRHLGLMYEVATESGQLKKEMEHM